MLAIKIWNYLRGYVIIRVEGLTLERLLNLAATYNIYLWDVKRKNNIVIQMKSTIKGYKELSRIIEKVGCRVEIEGKFGLPFFLSRLRERKMLVIGFMLFWLTIFYLSSTIWKIDILGNEQTPTSEIITLLKDNNVSIGKIKYTIGRDEIKEILINKYDYFSFISVTIKGSKLTIEIKELDLPPEKVDNSYPCHVVAKKKGIIIKITPKSGKSIVGKGAVVSEGDILINGMLSDDLLVHADGEVLAITRYSHIVRTPIVKTEEKETGNVFREKGIKIKNKGISFIKGDIPYKNYKEVVLEKDLINLEKYNISFPIKVINYEYWEVELKEIKQNIDYLKNVNQIEATKEINKELGEGVQIQSKNIRHQIDDNTLTTQVIIEALEDIGRKHIIGNRED